MSYEYAVVPAPKKGTKARGVKTTEDRFAFAIQTIMNEYGAAGWEYLRTDTLPCEERQGLTGRTTVFQNMLVFRKPLATGAAQTPEVDTSRPVEAPEVFPATAVPAPPPTPMLENKPLDTDPDRPEPRVAAE
ncbi:DUF4177 domain-containing protein [Yoonia sp. 208BN28-4]|uniref:DUF4177 domain-containing protein n=1 Tax=Yoonia sp. 208BN28-4 TaxID=3126505 RepID=UPI0030B529D4